ncbi:hypothetical protein PN466_03265 [Roseofilum reptotaenium CS-1145]|uniref:Uncharacterized protein n=1 Tax=Roseofilum reptotaenium AO1-A TaxID=1925591 RepID=A0A1L9QM44_9CYAN|nr:hypothetical protein [Roseofilum reptotaenium]MDB9515980.1 hypothetical protein [Roseofilum reptotaenium CS-1145]OJJ21907.1 hypothetical protein BI308_20105 [Roseofilum reptotaenium AO1-A]
MNTRSILTLLLSLSSTVFISSVQPAYANPVKETEINAQSYALMEKATIWKQLPTPDQTITALDISPTGNFAVGGSQEAIVHLWDLRAQQVVRDLHSHTAKVTSVVFSPNGRTFVSGSTDKTIKIWNLAMLRLNMTIYTDHEIHSLAVSPHGQTFASGNEDGTVEVWNLNTGKKRREFSTPIQSKVEVSYSDDGNFLVTRYPDRDIVHFWNPLTGELLGSNLAEDPLPVDQWSEIACSGLSESLGDNSNSDGFWSELCGEIASTAQGNLWANIDSNSIVLWRLPNPLKFTANQDSNPDLLGSEEAIASIP